MLKIILLTVVVAVLSRYIYYYLIIHNVGVHYNNHYPGKCRVIPGIDCGSEQISVTADGLAFITNGFRGITKCNPKFIKGKIYLFDFNHPERNVVQLQIGGSSASLSLDLDAFEPHGMDIIDDGETIKLYIINHANHRESVEVFIFDPSEKKLIHVKTITDEKFVCLNDITLVSEYEFYVTNWIKFCHYPSFMVAIELLGQLETGEVVHVKDGKSVVVANGPGFNGITQSKDRTEIIVAACSIPYLYVFNRQTNGELSLKTKVFVGHFPDNVYTDAISGVYYVGIQKHTFDMISRSLNNTKILSGTAVKVHTKKDWSKVDVEEIFHDEGRDFGGGVSAAVHHKGQYLFGTVYDRLVYCVKD